MFKRNWSGLIAALVAIGLLVAGLTEGERTPPPTPSVNVGTLPPKSYTKTPTVIPTNTPRSVAPTPTQELCGRMRVVASPLNVRSSPEVAQNIVDKLPYGTIVTLTNDEWIGERYVWRKLDAFEQYVAWFAIRGAFPYLQPYEGC